MNKEDLQIGDVFVLREYPAHTFYTGSWFGEARFESLFIHGCNKVLPYEDIEKYMVRIGNVAKIKQELGIEELTEYKLNRYLEERHGFRIRGFEDML